MARKRKKRSSTPHRANQRGTFRIDRTFPGVGRIAKASGTTDARVFDAYNDMLSALYMAGRLDILKQLRSSRTAGGVTFAEVWDAYRPMRGRVADLNRLPSPATIRALIPAMQTWAEGREVSETHRRNLLRDIKQLAAHAAEGATVDQLPRVLERYRARARKEGHPRAFNMTRTTALAFLRGTVGRTSSLYIEVAESPMMKERRQQGNPMSPADARTFVAALPPQLGRMFWAMCVTGMRPVEYWGAWEMRGDRIVIRNAKRKGMQVETTREIPLLERITPPERAWSSLKHYLWRSGTSRLTKHTPYDARRTFAHWMEEAGIPRSRRRYYLGHGIKDVTDIYERNEVTRFLASDARKLRAHVYGQTEPHPNPTSGPTTGPTTELADAPYVQTGKDDSDVL